MKNETQTLISSKVSKNDASGLWVTLHAPTHAHVQVGCTHPVVRPFISLKSQSTEHTLGGGFSTREDQSKTG